MKPTINTSKGGGISIQNIPINFDFYINPEGKIVKRELHTSRIGKSSPQILSLNEAGELYDPFINEMIIGCDDMDKIKLSNEATDFFEERKCKIKLLPLKEAITYWNRYEGHAVGLFHIPKK
jgi:hypothetical protein